MSQAEAETCRQRLPLISMRLFAGKTLLHVLSGDKPGDGFEPVAPDLEDLYFATIRGFIHGPGPGAPSAANG